MHVIFAVSDVGRAVAFYDRAWGERAAWFADPDGNVVAVAQATNA